MGEVVEIQGSCGVGQVREGGRKVVVDNNFERTVADSLGRKESDTERVREVQDSKGPADEQKYTRSHSDKQDNTCRE